MRIYNRPGVELKELFFFSIELLEILYRPQPINVFYQNLQLPEYVFGLVCHCILVDRITNPKTWRRFLNGFVWIIPKYSHVWNLWLHWGACRGQCGHIIHTCLTYFNLLQYEKLNRRKTKRLSGPSPGNSHGLLSTFTSHFSLSASGRAQHFHHRGRVFETLFRIASALWGATGRSSVAFPMTTAWHVRSRRQADSCCLGMWREVSAGTTGGFTSSRSRTMGPSSTILGTTFTSKTIRKGGTWTYLDPLVFWIDN